MAAADGEAVTVARGAERAAGPVSSTVPPAAVDPAVVSAATGCEATTVARGAGRAAGPVPSTAPPAVAGAEADCERELKVDLGIQLVPSARSWLLHSGDLEASGFLVLLGTQYGAPCLVLPTGEVHPLATEQRGGDLGPQRFLEGVWRARGAFEAIPWDRLHADDAGVKGRFQLDSGTEVHVAPAEGAKWLLPSGRPGRSLEPFAGAVVTGELKLFTLRFSSFPRPRASDLFGAVESGFVQGALPRPTRGAEALVSGVTAGDGRRVTSYEAAPAGVAAVARATVEPRRRATCYAPIGGAREIHRRLNVFNEDVMRRMTKAGRGIKRMKRVPARGTWVDSAYLLRTSMKKPTRGLTDARREELKAKVKPGAEWSIDWTHDFPEDPQGNRVALLAVDVKTDFVWHMVRPDRTAASLKVALDALRAHVRATFPGRVMEKVHGDNDTSWAVTGATHGLGETTPTAEIAAWLAALPDDEGFGFRTTAPYTHQHVQAERAMWPVYANMNANLGRARFAVRLWSGALGAAVWQVNAVDDKWGGE